MVRKFSAVCCVFGASVLRAWCFCAVCLVLLCCVLGVVSLVLYVVPYAVMQVLLRCVSCNGRALAYPYGGCGRA